LRIEDQPFGMKTEDRTS